MENELNVVGKEWEVVIVCGAEELLSAYEREVLERNRIPGLLPLSIEWIDDTAECHYHTEGCQSLALYYRERKLSLDEFQNLMKSIREILAQMEEYLLDPEGITLDPNMIFKRNNSKKMIFCYLLGAKASQEEEFHIMMDWITRKIDYSDRELVLAVYGIQSGELASADEWRQSFAGCNSDFTKLEMKDAGNEISYSKVVREESVNGSSWKGILTKIRKWFTLDESKNEGKTQ